MGACKVDITEKERNLTVKYTLNDGAGVKSLLRDRYRIAARRERGDYAACDILIDLNSAIESAGLTDRQAEAVGYVYGKWQLTQAEAARIMDVSREAVNQLIAEGTKRIAAVYERWDYGIVEVELPSEEVAHV